MKDYLSLLPSTLQWISKLLDSISPIPWPLWIGFLLPVYLGFLTVSVWILRGNLLPVRCAYPRTQRGGPCRKMVAGEWRRCRWHNHLVRYTYGHTVKPHLRRWETLTRSNKIVAVEESGVGILRLRPRGRALLYQNGYVRRPRDVAALVPERFQAARQRLRLARLRLPGNEEVPVPEENQGPVSTSEKLQSIVLATRFSLSFTGAALILTLVAILLTGQTQANAQWLATLAFVLAWAAAYSGIFQGKEDWRRNACIKAARWWAIIFVPVALANLFFAARGQAAA